MTEDDEDEMAKKKLPIRPRNIKNVQGAVVHQAGVDLRPSPDLVKKFKGDYDAAKHARAMRVKAHAVALTCGHFVKPYAVDQQRGSLDRRFVNIEVEGSFPGQDTGMLTGKLLTASKNALRYLQREVRAKGGDLKYIYAHRQFNKERRGDPGPEIWTKLVNGFAVSQLGLKTRPGYVSGSGAPIPELWNKMPRALIGGGGAVLGATLLFGGGYLLYRRSKKGVGHGKR